MVLETKKFAQAAAQAAGVAYVVCTAVVALFPSASSRLLGWITHVDPSGIAPRTVTLAGFILGLLQVALYAYVAAWLLAKFYSKAANRT